ncbi:metal ion transmembrane transporter [Fusarium subglutinans]|uniref:Metal ion transmembrane transporter n=1 Tax=Gibberella subglutinans TaxID=42677 RepID=A0A8H5NQT6_GIBSU|nr:metal ion transmembrane transporter [Fusarium subglutinans]KAF5573533.1 metal ion transmembrane transporter [Fusarium subglutinans]
MTKPCPKAVRALGHYLHITPRFFNFPYVPTSTGNHVADYAFFHLQFMDMYPPKIKPSEATRNQNSPHAQFNLGQGLTKHTWHITKVDLIYWNEKVEATGSNRGMGLISLDPVDDIIYKGLCKLMTRKETIPPGKWEEEFGLGQVLSEMFHIISVNWNTFLDEAEQHLQHIQKSYSLALHQLSPLWSEVRRRIVSAKDTAKQMMSHPFFTAVGGAESISSYLKKIILTLNDYETRTHELDTNTNILINLIFNLATFNDTAAAIQESKAANYLAASIRRVAMLTFFYLPLQIAASIYGMNINEITGGDGDHHIWEYVILSLVLMGLTFLFWYAWKAVPMLFTLRLLSRRQSFPTGLSPV